MPADDVRYDVAVIGAGAAGLVCAFSAAERGLSVVLLEKNRRPGVKILMSGGTRCNITNARGLHDVRAVSGEIDPLFPRTEMRGARAIQEAFGPAGSFLGPALRALSVEATVELFEAEGVATKIEAGGKIFPVSDRAVDVLNALLRRVERSGAKLVAGRSVDRITRVSDGSLFSISCGAVDMIARSVVVACGGQSYPGCGTTGDGYGIARSFGHTIREPRPALVPLVIEVDWIRGLRGLAVEDATVRVAEGARYLDERREAVLCTHFGLSGPAVLDVSRAASDRRDRERLDVEIDWLPGRSEAMLEAEIQALCRGGKRTIGSLAPEELPRRLADGLIAAAGLSAARPAAELSREGRRRFIETIKRLRLPIAGTLGFSKAEVTMGGVALEEVEPSNMQSRRVPGLFFCGEVLDLDGRVGGYNFQSAWSTGRLAGISLS